MVFEESDLKLINDDQKVFAIDLRSLAALRICLALIVLFVVFSQFSSLELLYTDDGILPRTLNNEYLDAAVSQSGSRHWSLYWMNGSFGSAQTLLVLTALAAGMMLLGIQSRLATLACLVLLWSLQVRNPLVLTAGDILLRMLLFWSVFLPTGSIWTINLSNTARRPKRWNIVSMASAAIMLQVAYMYFFSGISKWNDFWLSGSAVEYSMNLEMYVTPLGAMLSDYPALLKIATFLTLLAEIIFPLMLFIPRITTFNRGFAMGVFWLMHLGIWLTMSIGIFSITAICAWIVFIPSEQWNAMLGEPVGFREQRSSRVKPGSLIVNTVSGLFLLYITLQNLSNAGIWPANNLQLQRFGQATMTIQKFQMFDRPLTISPWFEYVGELETGEKVDLFYLPHDQFGIKPDSVYRYMQSQSWRRIHSNLITNEASPPNLAESHRKIRKRLLMQMVETWNDKYPNRKVKNAELICNLEPIQFEIDGQAKTTREVWATYEHLDFSKP